MPGMFGVIGCIPSCWDTLLKEFSTIWGEVEACKVDTGAVGGHAFGGAKAVYKLVEGPVFAIDGEASLYSRAGSQAAGVSAPIFHIGPDGLVLSEDCAGNVAVLDPISGSLSLGAAVSGSFPLYYAQVRRGLLFSSLLRPLTKAMACIAKIEPDMVGVIQKLRRGSHFFGNRTFVSGVCRLLPGQVLCFRPDIGQVTIKETSDFGAGGYDNRTQGLNNAADICWEVLLAAVKRSVGGGRTALMMSGGWDSRVLLAAYRAVLGIDNVLCYGHGDPASRELRIARDICEKTGVRFRLESMEEAIDPSTFDSVFARTESLISPEWQHAGRVLAGMGIKGVSAGVYGAVLGGQQGFDYLERGYRKIPVVLNELASRALRKDGHSIRDFEALKSAFSVRELGKPWYMLQDAWEAVPSVQESINADLDRDFRRLKARNIIHQDQLLEVFLVETRQSQYEIDQMLSCRAFVNISIPYGDHGLLRLAGSIPWAVKYNRTLMQRMLKRHAADLLDFPLSATLVPARASIGVQTVSRLIRHIDEQSRWRLHHATSGIIPYPRYGWWWYEFLKDGSLMHALVDDLRSEFWDRRALHARIIEQTRLGVRFDPRSTTANVFSHILRISTVDRLLRE